MDGTVDGATRMDGGGSSFVSGGIFSRAGEFYRKMETCLFLFDVDQTLILGAGCGRRSLEKAFHEVFGIPNSLEKISTSGKTDTAILDEMASFFKISLSAETEERVWSLYLSHLEKELRSTPEARINHGIREILDALQAEPSARLGLLTGNIREGARIKLSHFDLWRYFPTGGFGSDHKDRSRVAEVALRRCSEYHKINFRPEQVYVIGDSTRDIECAGAIKAKTVIVATGNDSYESLKKLKPYLLFETFSDYHAVLSSLQGPVHAKQGKRNIGTNPTGNARLAMTNGFMKVLLEEPSDFLNPYWYEQMGGINWSEKGETLVIYDRTGPLWNPRFPSSLFLNHNIKRIHLVLTGEEDLNPEWVLKAVREIFPESKNHGRDFGFDHRNPSFPLLRERLENEGWALLPEGKGFSIFFTRPAGESILNSITLQARKQGWDLYWVRNLYDFTFSNRDKLPSSVKQLA